MKKLKILFLMEENKLNTTFVKNDIKLIKSFAKIVDTVADLTKEWSAKVRPTFWGMPETDR